MKKIVKYISIALLALIAIACNKDNSNWTTILDEGVYLISNDSATLTLGESSLSKLTPIPLDGTSNNQIVGLFTWLRADRKFNISFASDAFNKQIYGIGSTLTQEGGQAYSLKEGGEAFKVDKDGLYQVIVNLSSKEINIFQLKWKVETANANIEFKDAKLNEKDKNIEWTTDGVMDLGNFKLLYNTPTGIAYKINSTYTGVADTLTEDFVKIIPLESSGLQLNNRFKANYTFTIRYDLNSKEFTAKALKGYPKVYVPGAHSGWGHTYYIIAPSYDANFEGFMHIDGDFKFTSAPNWDGTNYGDGGTGKLATAGDAGNLKLDPGFYLLKANTENLTWSAETAIWGVVGSGTPNGWGGPDIEMKDLKNNTLTVTADLVVGEIKFRTNNDWGFNLGGTGGKLKKDGDNIQIEQNGNYTITINLATPPEYTYTIVKN